MSRPTSPSPSLCASVLEKYISSRGCKDDYVRVPPLSPISPSSSVVSPPDLRRQVSVEKQASFPDAKISGLTGTSCSADQRRQDQDGRTFDISSMLASLPADGAVREQFMSQFIKCGYGSLTNLGKDFALGDRSWRSPSEAATHQTCNFVFVHQRVDLPTGTTANNANDAFNVPSTGAMCQSITRIVTANDPFVWNRQTNAIDIHHISAKWLCHIDLTSGLSITTPAVALPPVVFNFCVFVDTLALLSNTSPSSVTPVAPIKLYAGGSGGQASTDLFGLFDCSGIAPYGLAADQGQTYSTCMPAKAASARFKILYHRQETISFGQNVTTYGASGANVLPAPGRPFMHNMDLKLDPPVRAVYESENPVVSSPYINNVYVCCWANLYQNAVPANNTIVPYVSVMTRVDWEDVGQSD